MTFQYNLNNQISEGGRMTWNDGASPRKHTKFSNTSQYEEQQHGQSHNIYGSKRPLHSSPASSSNCNVRVVARIRPLSMEEVERGNVEAIRPVEGRSEQEEDGKEEVTTNQIPPSPKSLSSSSLLSPGRSDTKKKGKKMNSNIGTISNGRRMSFIQPPSSSPVPSRKKKDSSSSSVVSMSSTSSKKVMKKNITRPKLKKSLIVSCGDSNTNTSNNNHDKKKKAYDYDAVFDTSATQEEVYEQSGVRDAIRKNLFEGWNNTTILAYGETGSGKTFTMSGGGGEVEEDENGSGVGSSLMRNGYEEKSLIPLKETDGIIPRSVCDLFQIAKEHPNQKNISIGLTHFEIHNDEVRDLLDKNLDDGYGEGGHVSCIGGFENMEGLINQKVDNLLKVKKLMEEGSKRRRRKVGSRNIPSSRSHTICIFEVIQTTQQEEGQKIAKRAKLTLVDLAGSERNMKQTEGDRMEEESYHTINKDLFVLGKVISSFAADGNNGNRSPSRKKSTVPMHVPYRDSKLTRILRDCLGANCFTIVIACVSTADSDIDESINTLRYAERTRARNSSSNNKNIAVTTKNEGCSAIVPPSSTSPSGAVVRRENKILKRQVIDLKKRLGEIERRGERAGAGGNRDLRSHHQGCENNSSRLKKCEQRAKQEQVGPSTTIPIEDDISVASGLTQDDFLLSDIGNLDFVTDDSSQSSPPTTATTATTATTSTITTGIKKNFSEDDDELDDLLSSNKEHDTSSQKEEEEEEETKASTLHTKKTLQKEIMALEVIVEEYWSDLAELELVKQKKEIEIQRDMEDTRRTLLNEKSALKKQIQALAEERGDLIEEVEGYQKLSVSIMNDINEKEEEEQSRRRKMEKEISDLKKSLEDVQTERDSLRVRALTAEKEKDRISKVMMMMMSKTGGSNSNNNASFSGKENDSGLLIDSSNKQVKDVSNSNAGVMNTGVLCERKNESDHYHHHPVSNTNHNANTSESLGEKLEQLEVVNFNLNHQSTTTTSNKNNNTDGNNDNDGTDSVMSEQKAIRIHAAKMLFWANKAIEQKRCDRSVNRCDDASVGSLSTAAGLGTDSFYHHNHLTSSPTPPITPKALTTTPHHSSSCPSSSLLSPPRTRKYMLSPATPTPTTPYKATSMPTPSSTTTTPPRPMGSPQTKTPSRRSTKTSRIPRPSSSRKIPVPSSSLSSSSRIGQDNKELLPTVPTLENTHNHHRIPRSVITTSTSHH